jgi:hypothetical protein
MAKIIVGHGNLDSDDINRNPEPTDQEQAEINRIGQELFDKFLITENDQILDQYPEVYIRSAAIIAGMQVTDFEPKRIDWNFVTELRQTILKQKKNQ